MVQKYQNRYKKAKYITIGGYFKEEWFNIDFIFCTIVFKKGWILLVFQKVRL
jgi:hypothetical protein